MVTILMNKIKIELTKTKKKKKKKKKGHHSDPKNADLHL